MQLWHYLGSVLCEWCATSGKFRGLPPRYIMVHILTYYVLVRSWALLTLSRRSITIAQTTTWWHVWHICGVQGNSGGDCIGGTCPHFNKWLGTGAPWVEEMQTKKLTKLYWPSRKRSPKRLIVVLEPKKWRDTTKKYAGLCPHFRVGVVPPTFKFVPVPLQAGDLGCFKCPISAKLYAIERWFSKVHSSDAVGLTARSGGNWKLIRDCKDSHCRYSTWSTSSYYM